jgi:hypothetical protein
LDLVLAPTVAIAGRVVDADGVGVEAMVSVRFTRRSVAQMAVTTDGTFRFAGLRPGAHTVTATVEGATREETIEVHAPIAGVEVPVRWLPEGLLLVGPQADGQCPRGVLELRRPDGKHVRGLFFEECQSTAWRVRPGVVYRVKGNLTGRRYDKEVVFAGAPAPPICLDLQCGPDAAVRIRVVDRGGTLVEGDTVLEITGGVETRAVFASGRYFQHGLPSGIAVDLRATLGRAADAPAITSTTTAWLAPGINQIVIRLPQSLAALP